MAGAIITLCTDFGWQDSYVAAMKGAILSIARDVTLVDLTHDIPRHAVRQAAFVLWSAARYFPVGAIHLVVVDPGVGSVRRAIAVRTERAVYVAPDNGVLSYVLREEPLQEAHELTERRYWRVPEASATFHGRDIFAPAAAHIANGVPLSAFGGAVTDPLRFELAIPRWTPEGELVGEAIHVDAFGNLVTDIPAELLGGLGAIRVRIGAHRIEGLSETYVSAERGALLALIGSHGNLEIAVREGSAAAATGAGVGATVRVTR